MEKGIYYIVIGLLFFCNSACSSDGPEEDNPKKTENKAPSTFGLTSLADEATAIGLMPSFSWEKATDPDGDTVTYDFYLDKENPPTTVYEANLSSTTFSVLEELNLVDTYYWKVEAKDSKGNATTSNQVYSFTTRDLTVPNNSAIGNPAFGKRRNHASIKFKDKLWLIGGLDRTTLISLNDVWQSDNGTDWTLITDNADFPIRHAHTVAVFDDKLWVIGGISHPDLSSEIYRRDVWYSADGATWTQATDESEYPVRYLATTVVFDNKLWIIGGAHKGLAKQDVWYSNDGVIWTEATSNAAFLSRGNHESVVFDDKIWVIGGGRGANRLNDVWFSENGINWTAATTSAAFPERIGHTAVTFKGRMWIIGGFNNNNEYLNDIWHSDDGVTWKQTQHSDAFDGRLGHSATIYNDKIWVIAGNRVSGYTGEIWAFN